MAASCSQTTYFTHGMLEICHRWSSMVMRFTSDREGIDFMSAERVDWRDEYSLKNGFGFGNDPLADRSVKSQLEFKGIELGLGAGTAFALATSTHPVSRVADLDNRVAGLGSTQAEINAVGRAAGEQLMQQYLDGTSRLAEHRRSTPYRMTLGNGPAFLDRIICLRMSLLTTPHGILCAVRWVRWIITIRCGFPAH